MKSEAEIKERMEESNTPGASIAYFTPGKPISPKVLGTTDMHTGQFPVDVESDTIFGAASLSKPVFSYLVLKMIGDQKILANKNSKEPFTLDTPISKIYPIEDFYKNDSATKVSKEFAEEGAKITPRMVLSHTTGIPINGASTFDFTPGTAYAYGNMALRYLQKALEKEQNKSLEALAKEDVFNPLGMTHSSYVPGGKTARDCNAANSLSTTPSDYAILITAWMQGCGMISMSDTPTLENQSKSATSNYILTKEDLFYYNKLDNKLSVFKLDASKLEGLHKIFSTGAEEKLNNSLSPIGNLSDEALKQITAITGHSSINPTLQEAFKPQISLQKDQWALDMGVSDNDTKHLEWGLGFGLELDDAGKVTSAFHTGDMDQWRGWVAMDMKSKSGVVYFANGNESLNHSGHGYGHVLAELIVKPVVELKHTFNWFFQKFGLARNVEPGWKENETADTARIGAYVRSHLKTNESDTLDNARERMAQFKNPVADLRRGASASTDVINANVETKSSSPSPLQTTLKPKFPGED